MFLIEQPTELLVHIFGHLDVFDLMRLSAIALRFSKVLARNFSYVKKLSKVFWVIVDEDDKSDTDSSYFVFNSQNLPSKKAINLCKIPNMLPAGFEFYKGKTLFDQEFYAFRAKRRSRL